MSHPLTNAEPAGAPPAAGRRPSVMTAVAAVAVVVLVTGILAQLAGPFIRRDDWPYLLPDGAPGAADPLAKVREEGRWANYGWWLLVGQHGTPVTAVVVFFTTYVLFAVGLWRLLRVTGRVTAVVLGVALLVSPLWIRLIYWPGTLSASAVVAAAGVWSLPWAARRRPTLVAWAVLAAVLAMLTYPPVGALLLVAAAVHLRDRPWRGLLLVVATFLLGLVGGVAVAFLLNRIAFGHFGVAIAEWRNPNRLSSPADLWVNARSHAGQLVVLARTLGPATVVGVVAVVVAALDPRVRPVLLRVLLALAVVAGLEGAQTLMTGVRTNVRGSLWAWPAAVLPAALLLTGSTRSRRIGQVLLVVLSLVGLLAWRSDLATHQATKRAYDEIVAQAVATGAGEPPRQVVFHQDPGERRTARGGITAGTLRMMFLEQAGVVVRWCRPPECAALAERARHGPVHDLGPVTGVVVPTPPEVL